MRLLLSVALLFFSAPALAEGGHISDLLKLPLNHSIMTLSAQANVDVEQDLLTANLIVKEQHKDPAELQNIINKNMASALKNAEKHDDIQSQTLHYSIYEHYPNPKIRMQKIWKGEQGLSLKSTNKDKLLKLIGTLQSDGLILQNLGFSVSQKLREDTQDALLENVIDKLTAKAKRMAKALGKDNAEILEIKVNDNGGDHYRHQPRSMYMESDMMMSAKSVSAPVASAGQTNISVSAGAYVLIKP